MSHVYGPVPSRRLGRSLGVDLVPYKTCSFDCIYCQLKRTTLLTTERKEWVPLDAVVEDIRQNLDCKADYITLSGSGDPTLFSRLGELIEHIHQMTDIPVAVLTNSALLWREDVLQDLCNADLLIPSLDAGDEDTLQLVNRPAAGIDFGHIIDGLIKTRDHFSGQLWLEIMLVNEWNSSNEQVRQIADQVRRIRPERIQLNTVTRPATKRYAKPVSPERLKELADTYLPGAELITSYQGKPDEVTDSVSIPHSGEEPVLSMLIRRPCTLKDLADGLHRHPNEMVKELDRLRVRGKIHERNVGAEVYYTAN